MAPLIDVTPFVAILDQYLALADPYFQTYFYHIFVALFLVFGLALPAGVTTGQIIMAAFFWPMWAGMAPINAPLTFGGIIYFGIIIWQVVAFIG